MTNYDYQLEYGDFLVRKSFHFLPKARLTAEAFDSMVAALTHRFLMPRLPQPGDVLLMRPRQHGVVACTGGWEDGPSYYSTVVGSDDHRALTDCGQTATAYTYLLLWKFVDPVKENLS